MKVSSKWTAGMLTILAALMSATAAQAWTYTASGPWASFSFGSWTVYQNEWGSPDVPCDLYANSAGNWASAGSWTGSGTKGYPHVQGNPNIPIGSYWCNANFNFSAPAGATYTVVFDCWTAGHQDELMIEEYWGGPKGHWGTQIASNVTLGGRLYESIWQASNGANPVYIFTPASQRTSGTTDLMACFVWCRDRGLLHNSTLYEVSFGAEITATSGWQQFTCNSFSCSFGSNGGGGTTYYKLANRATGLCIDGMGRTGNGSNCGQYSSGSSFNQQWAIETAGSYVKLKNRGTGLYIDGAGRTANGSVAGQWSSSSSSNQQWTQSTTGSYYKYRNRSTGLYLDGLGYTANGSDLYQWASSTSNNQQFSRTAQ